ncbi:hypothetical protein MCEMAEM4_00462 [Burkholderiaceae bacterium]
MLNFKAFSGSIQVRTELESWLSQIEDLKITNVWEPDPKEDWGTWGVFFSYKDKTILKTIKKEWLKKGVVVELTDTEIS